MGENDGTAGRERILAVVDMLDRPIEEVLVSVRRKFCPEQADMGSQDITPQAHTDASLQEDITGSFGATKKRGKKKSRSEQQKSLTLT